MKIISFFSLILVFLIAGCSSETTPGGTPLNTQTQTTQTQTTIQTQNTQINAQLKTYNNTEYGFELRYPNDWYFKMDTSGDAPIFLFTKNQDGTGSLLAIVPKGESDRGVPPGTPTTLTATLSNKNAQIQEWQLSDGKILKIYNFLDQIQNWEKCESDLKNCNRIELQADSAKDMDTLEEMLETFRFTK